MILLIHPPVTKPCEAPAGIAKLAGALELHGVKHRVVDANLEGLLHLLNEPLSPADTWTDGAMRRLPQNIAALRAKETYRRIDRYKRAVSDLNRVLKAKSAPCGAHVTMSDYQQEGLVSVRSSDLLESAEHPKRNPFYSYFSRRLSDIIEAENPSLIGFSVNYLSQALCAFAMIGFIKKMYPLLGITAGGGLITSWMKIPGWKSPFASLVDELVCGPGEGALLDRFGFEYRGKSTSPSYDSFSFADYFAPGAILPYSASSGCYYRSCAFCPEKTEGNAYLPLVPQQVLNDVNCLTKKTGASLVHFLDNALSPFLLRSLAEEPPGVSWYGFARATGELANRDFCRALKNAGCVMLKLGVESGDQDVLDNLQKGIDLSVVSPVLSSLHEAGIATYVYLLFGTPPETEKEARRTLDFTVRHSDLIDFLNLAVFNLPAHGPDVDRLDTGSFYEGDLSLYRSFVHPQGWERNVVRRFLDREFKRHPAIAPILRRDPPVFTSNHAPFFAMIP